MKFALCQIASGADKGENLAQIAEFAERAAREGARLAVFPEFSMFFEHQLSAEFVAQAETLDGPFVRRLTGLARELNLHIIAGMLEQVPGEDRAANVLVAVSPAGVVATYRKAHLYDAFGFHESEFIRPGETDGPVTIEVDGVRVGMLTCYDLRFPEAARQHADVGTELLVYPAAWVPGPRKEDHWATLARARAIENTLYVGAVSQAPRGGIGSSIIADPMGLVLGELGERTGIVLAEVDAARIAEVRETNPCLANRRFRVAPR